MELEKLTAEQRQELVEALILKRKKAYEESYYEFFKDAWKVIEPTTDLIPSPHIKYICDVLQKATLRLISGEMPEHDLIIINVPPGASKSATVTKIWNAWVWALKPSIRIISSSYSADLSAFLASKSLDIIRSKWYQSMWGDKFQISKDKQAVSHFANTELGYRIATSTGGLGTGFHCDIWIDDDPLNVKMASSDKLREDAKNHSTKTVPSRVVGNGFRVMIMQRLNEEDPTGVMLEDPETSVFHVCLPAKLSNKVKPPDAVHLYTDGYLIPNRFNETYLKKKLSTLGSFEYAGQYDQSPTPRGGGYIKEDWFKYENDTYHMSVDLWVDGAYTRNTANDPTGIMVCGFYLPKNTLYVHYFEAKWMNTPEAVERIIEIADTFRLDHRSRIFIEPKATGYSFIDTINESTPYSVVKIKGKLVSQGKKARIEAASPKYEAGKIVHLKGHWNELLEHQLTGFPNAKHDEGVDLIGYAAKHYFKRKRGIRY